MDVNTPEHATVKQLQVLLLLGGSKIDPLNQHHFGGLPAKLEPELVALNRWNDLGNRKSGAFQDGRYWPCLILRLILRNGSAHMVRTLFDRTGIESHKSI